MFSLIYQSFPLLAQNVNWGVEFEPTIASIQRLKMMISANSEEKTFIARTEGNE